MNECSFGGDDPQTVSDLANILEYELEAYDYDGYPTLQYLSSGEESDGQSDDEWDRRERREWALGARCEWAMDELYRMLDDDLDARNADQEELKAKEDLDDSYRSIRHEREEQEWPEFAPRQYDETQQAADSTLLRIVCFLM